MTIKQSGTIFDIQRFCLHDGPGIRTTVFFKGCDLRCPWCHNPESVDPKPQLFFYKDKCVNCFRCFICPNEAHGSAGTGTHVLYREKCLGCGKCVSACPQNALEITGRETTLDEVMDTVIKDAKYYKSSGGGITFSGGEAALQFSFLLELMKLCKNEGYHCALETNGMMVKERLRELINYTDLFLLDYKASDAKIYADVIGGTRDDVMETLRYIENEKGHVILRCPIIPTVNDNPAHFNGIREIKNTFTCVENVEILTYHDIGKSKWSALGLPYSLGHLKTVPPSQKSVWEKLIF